MSETEQSQDVVLLFDADGRAVEAALRMPEFERRCDGAPQAPAESGRQIRAAYVTVAPGLKVDGIVFFTLTLAHDGRFTPGFNVALSYLMAQAGIRSDLGLGRVRVASRAQCPVPWVAGKLWEPEPGETGTGQVIQRAILLNRAGLRSVPGAAVPLERHLEPSGRPVESARFCAAEVPVEPGSVAPAGSAAVSAGWPGRAPAGTVSTELHEQLRRYRAEVLELKAALRHERELNRRLQALLRGEI